MRSFENSIARTAGRVIVRIREALPTMNWNPFRTVGEEIDRHNGIAVYYNGAIGHTRARNLAADGYNLGLPWQCVEFVKRYYHGHLGHRMPNSYGHAKDFFDPSVADGARNPARDLLQFRNGGRGRPQVDDLLVFEPTWLNPYGHVAIVSAVAGRDVEIVQQNSGPFGSSRARLAWILRDDGVGELRGPRPIYGWLRKETTEEGRHEEARTRRRRAFEGMPEASGGWREGSR